MNYQDNSKRILREDNSLPENLQRLHHAIREVRRLWTKRSGKPSGYHGYFTGLLLYVPRIRKERGVEFGSYDLPGPVLGYVWKSEHEPDRIGSRGRQALGPKPQGNAGSDPFDRGARHAVVLDIDPPFRVGSADCKSVTDIVDRESMTGKAVQGNRNFVRNKDPFHLVPGVGTFRDLSV